MTLKNKKGQSIIEALIALGAAATVVSAIAIAVISALNNADYSKKQNLATQYAREGMEILKQKSENDWNSFSGLSAVNYCLSQGSTTLSPGQTGCSTNITNSNAPFVRSITIYQAEDFRNVVCIDTTYVSVKVAWTDGKCTSSSNVYCHSAFLESCLANINSLLGP